MADQITNYSENADDGSYSFAFLFDDGNGNQRAENISVLASDGATDVTSARSIAITKAAAAKKEWLDGIATGGGNIVGPVALPTS